MSIISPKDKIFQMRLNETEQQLLKKEAEKAGFKSVSDFVRNLTFGDGKGIQQETRDNVRRILEILEEKKEEK